MEKVDDMSHSYALAPLSDQYVVHMEEIEDDHDQITAENTDDSNTDGEKIGIPLREQDRFLPIANVAKIMKKAIPEAGKIAKDARECVQECVSEFISFITSEASDRCHMEKRKTINGEDILVVMSTLGFDNYDIRNRIADSCLIIKNTPHIFERVRHSMIRRLNRCIESGGGHFQHLL